MHYGVVATALVVLAALAAPALGARVAYVDYARLVHDAPQAVASRDAMKKEFSPRRMAIARELATVKRLRRKLRNLEPDGESLEEAAVLEDLRQARTQLATDEKHYETRLKLRLSAVRASFRNLVRSEIAAYAQAHGIGVVLRDGVAYAAPNSEITGAILARLKKDYRDAQRKVKKQ